MNRSVSSIYLHFLLLLLGLFLCSSTFVVGQNGNTDLATIPKKQLLDTLDNNQVVWVHTVKAKEQLPSIALLYGIEASELKTFNELKSNYLNSEMPLQIPFKLVNGKQTLGHYQLHKVNYNEQLPSIAQKYKTDLHTIKKMNRLQANTLAPNSYLLVPTIKPNLGPKESVKVSMNGFAAVSFFAGNDWDGSTNINYAINGRYNIRRAQIKDQVRNLSAFSTTLGYRHDIGEYFFKNIDRFEFKNQFEYSVSNFLTPFFFTSFRSQYLNGYFYNESGDKTLISSLFAPAYSHAALGLTYSGDFYIIDIGIYEVKTTYVFNQALYKERPSAYGVKAKENTRSEHGISLRTDIFFYKDETIKFQSNLYAFATSEGFDVECRNEFSYKVNKFLQFGATAEFLYDKDYAETIQFKTSFNVGVSFYK